MMGADERKIEREKVQVEREKLAHEKSFAKKWAASVLGFAGVVAAAILSAAALFASS